MIQKKARDDAFHGLNPVLDAIATCRAVRRFTPDPVPVELLRALVFAATRAPSPRNLQPWAFVVVRDRSRKAALAELMAAPAREVLRRAFGDATDEAERRMYTGSAELVESLATVPALIFACATGIDRGQPVNPRIWASVYPAVQNLLVAARSFGLGTTLATFHFHVEDEARRLLGLPDDAIIAATIPVGWPAVPFGPVARRPIDEVLHWERWGMPPTG